MTRFLISILFILILAFIITLLSGTIQAILIGGAIFYYVIFLFIYAIICFIAQGFNSKPLSESTKTFLLISTILIFLGYFIWNNYDALNQDKIRRQLYTAAFREELENLPQKAMVRANHSSFFASVENLKDKDGKQLTFKWGDYELARVNTVEGGIFDVVAFSPIQPEVIPNKIQCDGHFYLTHKDKNPMTLDSGKEYRFDYCPVKEWNIRLNNQEISLYSFELHYIFNLEIENGDSEKVKNIKSAATNLGINEKYFFADLPGYFKINDLWVIDTPILLIDNKANPIALIGNAISRTGYTTKIGECAINDSYFNALFTNLKDESFSLNIENIINKSKGCNNIIEFKVYLSYVNEKLEKRKELGRITKNNVILLQDFSNIPEDTYIEWYPEYPRLHSLFTEHGSFYWGDLNLSNVEIHGNTVWTSLVNHFPMKIGDFFVIKPQFLSVIYIH
ncbi:hypothetical protein BKK47_11060 [Rodentibacter mrazii]|uniref:Uncharacterized protein n=1 Tax=Rodentibacter mrazii TaxID=1908257 RepID=A0A1V3IBD9_9PAST|nr:hypothetical protein [Rodentibacter mrazii]OOF37411.1 hypothetical protein BKK47_11060 [Rodentibacter mrazii]